MTKKAFTLIELLVTIGILAVVAAGVVALINPLEKTRQANDAKIQSDIGQLSTAFVSFAAQQNDGVYPCETATAACTQNPTQGGFNSVGPAGTDELSVIPAPPAGSAYTYRSNPAGGTRNVTDFVVFAPLLSSKYNTQCTAALGGTTAYMYYSSQVGRACIGCGAAGGYATYAAAVAALPACDFL